MRDRQRLELKPGEYKDAKQGERREILRRLLEDLELARERGDRWYVEALAFAHHVNHRPLR